MFDKMVKLKKPIKRNSSADLPVPTVEIVKKEEISPRYVIYKRHIKRIRVISKAELKELIPKSTITPDV